MKKFNGINSGVGDLFLLSDAVSRSISAENFTGEKGKGGMSTDGLAFNTQKNSGKVGKYPQQL